MAGDRAHRVLLVDDHEVVRQGIRALVESDPDFRVVGEAGTFASALEAVERCVPDLVVMDVRLEDGNGIEATREIIARHPRIRVLILTSFEDDEALLASVLAGAAGYVLKEVRGGELMRAIRRVASGETLITAEFTQRVMDRVRRGKHLVRDPRLSSLSPQEEQVLALIAEGRTNREIGHHLGLAEKTVKNYVSSILSKLDASHRAEAAAYLARHDRDAGRRVLRW